VKNIRGEPINSDNFLFQILALEDRNIVSEATAFSPTNAPIFLTAAHVLDIFPELRPNRPLYPVMKINELLPKNKKLFLGVRLGEFCRLCQITEITLDKDFDLALFTCSYNTGVFPCLEVFENPIIDTKVSCMGFDKNWNTDVFDLDTFIIKKWNILITDGVVSEVNHCGTNGSMWYPTIGVTLKLTGGMSGGPCVTKNGTQLIGINSKGNSFGGTSYVQYFAKAMDRQFCLSGKIEWDNGETLSLNNFTLRSLIEKGFINQKLVSKLAYESN